MNNQNAHLYLPFVQALAEGKLQYNGGTKLNPDWQDITAVNWSENPEKYRIKPLDFPPHPEGTTLHNPDNLTPEQVGERYRLPVVGESYDQPHEKLRENGTWDEAVQLEGCFGEGLERSYRLPISTPYPDGSKVVDGELVKPESAWIDFSVAEALRKELQPGQKVIWRDAFRWKDDKGVLSNHYEQSGVAYLAEDFGYTVIKDAGCAAIIVDKDWKPEPTKPIPLGPKDWMKDGPWWIRQKGTTGAKMVVELRDVGLSSGHNHDWPTYSVTEFCERSNDGINWTPCHKLP